MKPRVSFIVPVRNDAARLETCLRSIRRNQSRCSARSRLSSSTTDRPTARRTLPDVSAREVMVVEDAPVAELRNRGARQATGDILAFVDADNEIRPGWVRAAIEILQMPGVGAAGALYRAPADGHMGPAGVRVPAGHGRKDRATVDVARQRQHGGAPPGVRRSRRVRHVPSRPARTSTSVTGFEPAATGSSAMPASKASITATRRRFAICLRASSGEGATTCASAFGGPFVVAALPSAVIPVVDAAMLASALVGLLGAGRGLEARASARRRRPSLMLRRWTVAEGDPRCWRGSSSVRVGHMLQAFVVACVYDLGRALALVARAPHRGARPRTRARRHHDAGRFESSSCAACAERAAGRRRRFCSAPLRTDPRRFAVTVCYLRDARDPVFSIDAKAGGLPVDYVEIIEAHSFDPSIWPRSGRLVRDRGIDIVHAHDYKTDLLAWLLAKFESVTPLSTAHGWTGHSRRERWLYYPLDKRVLAGSRSSSPCRARSGAS